jgi:hypothetical protein
MIHSVEYVGRTEFSNNASTFCRSMHQDKRIEKDRLCTLSRYRRHESSGTSEAGKVCESRDACMHVSMHAPELVLRLSFSSSFSLLEIKFLTL